MNNLKEILTSKKAQAFYWTTLNGFIGIIAVGMTNVDWVYTPLIIALLNGITKYINKDILQNGKRNK